MTVVGAIRPEGDPTLGMVGTHPLMEQLREEIRRAARLDAPAVVWGPTGAGKELVARALHALSAECTGPYQALNVAALAESVVDTELFGSVRGAFTGATNRPGLIEAAGGGVLFLDEAADLPPAVQAKLLRVLDSGEIRRVGEVRTRAVRFRLVVAVQSAPEALVTAHRWREDFYYRVAGVPLRVPRLAERRSDLAALARHLVGRHGLPPLDAAAIPLLEAHDWPGNVRELEQTLVRASHFAPNAPLSAADVRAALMRLDGESLGGDGSLKQGRYRDARAALRACAGDTTQAAALLGISRSHLYRLLRGESSGSGRTPHSPLGERGRMDSPLGASAPPC